MATIVKMTKNDWIRWCIKAHYDETTDLKKATKKKQKKSQARG
jgi:hypothetical protein